MTQNCNWISRVRINVSWFRKYDAFFIFHDTVFSTYPENRNTKERFCFPNRGTKRKFFLAGKVKNDFNKIRIWYLLKQWYWCCLEIRFFSLILLVVRFCNSFQLYVFLDILRIVLQLLNVVLNLCIINNYIVASHLI